MGIDIYARWKDQGLSDAVTQVSAWPSTVAGAKGYLREAYHGAPYATRYLCPEAFDAPEGAPIAASLLRDRLPHALYLVEARSKRIYQSSDEEIEDAKQSFRDFVDLCERKETETGEPVVVVASY